jgi:sugar/nucleoside kinase (ribokinase family)
MSLLVVGSIAFDSIETPAGKRESVLGGSASYFSYAASFFTKPRLVGVAGRDFPEEHVELLRGRGIDLAGFRRVAGKTFRWSGRYTGDMNDAETLAVELNVFGGFKPKIPASYRDSRYVFLANGSPETQAAVLDQMSGPRFVVADTMNFWIETKKRTLLKLLKRVDALVLNDGEARMLAGTRNLIAAGEKLLHLGPKVVLVKKGEHGSFLFSPFFHFALPAFPLNDVKDPTGAGDTFAGGFMGYLAQTDNLTLPNLKRAMAFGTVVASYTVEDFSLERLKRLTRSDIDHRFEAFLQFVSLS